MSARITGSKVLYVFEYFPPHHMGGAEISGKLRVEELSADNDITVLTPNYDEYSYDESGDDYRIIRFPSFRSVLYKHRDQTTKKVREKSQKAFSYALLLFYVLSALEMKYWIWRTHRKHGPFDVLHGNNIESDLGVAASNIPADRTAHLRDTIIFDAFPSSNVLIRYIKRRLRRGIDTFIAISKYIQEQFQEILDLPDERFEVVYNPVSSEQVCDISKRAARKRLGWERERSYVLFVGSLTKKKGVDYIVDELAPHFPEACFVIVGKGDLYEELSERAGENVRLEGFVDNTRIKYYYKAADVVLVPSRWEEPLGRVSLEAQANDAYVIVSEKGGLPETLQDGRAGVSVRLESFGEELRKVL